VGKLSEELRGCQGSFKNLIFFKCRKMIQKATTIESKKETFEGLYPSIEPINTWVGVSDPSKLPKYFKSTIFPIFKETNKISMH